MGSRVHGKVALVTGAARGIGLASARALHREGADVWLTDLRGDECARESAALGPRAHAARLDVREERDWTDVLQRVLDQSGRLDALVNNAGISGFADGLGPQDPERCSLEDWRAVHAVNAEGVFLGCKHAIRAMRRCGGAGSIVNVSSRSGVVGVPGAAPYAASKAAVRNHTKTVALYCAQEGLRVRCNSVHPAAILTPMWDAVLGEGEAREAALRDIAAEAPLGRWGQPEEVAAAIVYLVSDESAYITGIELTIDGGILAGAAATPRALADR